MEVWFIMIIINIVISCLLFYIKIYISCKYKRDGSNDYIAVDVYIFKKIVAYSMQIPIVKISSAKNLFLIESKIQTNQSQDRTHIKREKRFIKKTVTFYLKHPRKIRHIARQARYYVHLYCQVMDKFINSVHCEQLHWKTEYGSEDAAITGIGTGVLWAVKDLLLTRFKKRIILTVTPIINVNPIFGHNAFKVHFQCIFTIRLGNVINAMRSLYAIKR